MKVFLTGATGFVGAHTARALLEAGHELRLLVRNPDAARQYFSRHGDALDDLLVADMRDAEVIRRGMAGCDAVLHAAAAVSLDNSKAEATYRNNVDGMRTIIGTACEMGIANIVYVSSLSVLFQPGLAVIDESTPLASAAGAYARSKRDCDAWVRAQQAQGQRIQMTYPSSIIGPDDPRLSEANYGVAEFLRSALPRTSTGFQAVDVRDLAQVHRFLLEHPPQQPCTQARYIVGGHYLPWAQLHALLCEATGRTVFSPRVPGLVFRLLGQVVDWLRHLLPIPGPISVEAMGYLTRWVPADSSRVLAHCGIPFRAAQASYADTIRWLVAAGHLSHKQAGRLA